MKKKLKLVGLGIGAFVALVLTGIVVHYYVLSPKVRPAPVMTAPTNLEAIERGRYLAWHVAACMGCHSPVQSTVPGEPPVERAAVAAAVPVRQARAREVAPQDGLLSRLPRRDGRQDAEDLRQGARGRREVPPPG